MLSSPAWPPRNRWPRPTAFSRRLRRASPACSLGVARRAGLRESVASGDTSRGMALYAFVALKYLAPLDRMLQTVDRHRASVRELHAWGKSVCSGPFVPREGGAMLRRIDDPSEIGPLLAKDPYHLEKLVSDTIYVWDPNIGREGLDSMARPQS